jgi:hypothetical protein
MARRAVMKESSKWRSCRAVDLGEGSLAWFVLVLMTVLQNLVLGERDLLPYLRLLQKPSTSGT